jgi:hypothetical protein
MPLRHKLSLLWLCFSDLMTAFQAFSWACAVQQQLRTVVHVLFCQTTNNGSCYGPRHTTSSLFRQEKLGIARCLQVSDRPAFICI